MSLQEEPLDTTASESESTTTIILLSILATLILLNVLFYFLYRRLTRVNLKVEDITLSVHYTPRTPSEDLSVCNGHVCNPPKSSSQIELRRSDGRMTHQHAPRSKSETDMIRVL